MDEILSLALRKVSQAVSLLDDAADLLTDEVCIYADRYNVDLGSLITSAFCKAVDLRRALEATQREVA